MAMRLAACASAAAVRSSELTAIGSFPGRYP